MNKNRREYAEGRETIETYKRILQHIIHTHSIYIYIICWESILQLKTTHIFNIFRKYVFVDFLGDMKEGN